MKDEKDSERRRRTEKNREDQTKNRENKPELYKERMRTHLEYAASPSGLVLDVDDESMEMIESVTLSTERAGDLSKERR